MGGGGWGDVGCRLGMDNVMGVSWKECNAIKNIGIDGRKRSQEILVGDREAHVKTFMQGTAVNNPVRKGRGLRQLWIPTSCAFKLPGFLRKCFTMLPKKERMVSRIPCKMSWLCWFFRWITVACYAMLFTKCFYQNWANVASKLNLTTGSKK